MYWENFWGWLLYNLLLVSVVGIFLIAGFATVKSLDVPPLLCASLGLYLFFTTLTAIGIFMSSLTTYQVVSAIATFIVLFILNSIGGLWQQYDFIRDLTSFLSLSGRLEKMILGLLTTKDVLYYLIYHGHVHWIHLAEIKGRTGNQTLVSENQADTWPLLLGRL